MNEFSEDTQLLIKESNLGMTHSRQSLCFESLKLLTVQIHRAKDNKGRNFKSQENGWLILVSLCLKTNGKVGIR